LEAWVQIEWDSRRLGVSELADYAKSTGTAMFSYSENKAGYVVGTQGALQVLEGKKSSMTLSRIQDGKLGFEWSCHSTMEDRLSELVEYRKSRALQRSSDL
jgi:hypothetical protein